MNLKFYQNLGKLFYAIAAIDFEVNAAEINKLKNLVRKHWLDMDDVEDTYGTDAAYQIEIVFDWLNKNETKNGKACYDDFVRYKNEQKYLFTKEVKKMIMKTAGEIAQSFAGKNKSELILLAKLNIEFKKKLKNDF